jgi:hypothetical protein
MLFFGVCQKVKVKVKVNDASSFLWNHEYTQTEFALALTSGSLSITGRCNE